MTNAELDVIGSMLIDDSCIDDIAKKLKESDFSSDIAKSIFSAICEAWFTSSAIDPVLIAVKTGSRETAEKVMLDAMSIVTTSANALEYARIVKSDAEKRRAAEIADSVIYGGDIGECAMRLQEIAEKSEKSEVINGGKWCKQFSETLERNMADPDSAFCKTGYSDLDDVLGGGMVKGGLYIVGARPGMGKTTFAINIAERIVKRGQRVLFISLEMSPHQIMCKRIPIECDVQYKRILYGRINEIEKESVYMVLGELEKRAFFTNTGFSMTVSDIGNLARCCKGCDCLMIDYFGLISSPDESGSRYEVYSIISRQLKQLAGTLNIPILCLAQLNREIDKGNGSGNQKKKLRKPNLSDLRDTGSLEQDADSVIFLHRDEYYDGENSCDSEIDVIVRKNRHGDCGEIKMFWDGKYGRIGAFDAVHEDSKDGELEF